MHSIQINVRTITEPLLDVERRALSNRLLKDRPMSSPAKPAPAAATCGASSLLSCDGAEVLFCVFFN